MKVLVIPEDQELDRYIVKPVIEALFADLQLAARVDVLPEPRLRGANDALDPQVIRGIVDENPMADLFLLVVDRDCNREKNEERARGREREHQEKLVACLAHQELEVWMLALYKDELDASFTEVRAECDPKERWASSLLAKLGTDGPGQGRKRAMRALKGKWRSLRDTCTELRDLEDAIRIWNRRPR